MPHVSRQTYTKEESRESHKIMSRPPYNLLKLNVLFGFLVGSVTVSSVSVLAKVAEHSCSVPAIQHKSRRKTEGDRRCTGRELHVQYSMHLQFLIGLYAITCPFTPRSVRHKLTCA